MKWMAVCCLIFENKGLTNFIFENTGLTRALLTISALCEPPASGQGLAIAHSIVVDKHGGSLTVESQVGDGATFAIWLPVDGSSAAPVAPNID